MIRRTSCAIRSPMRRPVEVAAPLVVGLVVIATVALPTPPDDCAIPRVFGRAIHAPGNLTGRYTADGQVLYLASCGLARPAGAADSVAVEPESWTSIEYALRAGPDSFAVVERPRRTVVFERGSDRRVTAVRTTGFDLPARMQRVREQGALGIEPLIFGTNADSVAQAIASSKNASALHVDTILDNVFFARPSRRRFIAAVTQRLAERWPTSLPIARDAIEDQAMIGDTGRARAMLRERQAAVAGDTGFQRLAAWLDGGRTLPDTGWRVSVTPEAVLAPPTDSEIRAVRREIDGRRRDAIAVTTLSQSALTLMGGRFRVEIVAHEVDGHRHVGAVLIPADPLPSCCATIIDIKGINARYSPLRLDPGPPSLRRMGTAARAYIYVVPAIRGERLLLGDSAWQAEGDRTDGWDGGAEDALALLSAASTIEHRIDRSRVCVFGESRGGAVALLVAERDSTIRCVVAMSPPVDWFDAMWADSWPKTTLLRVALRTHAGPFAPGGQFVEWVMAPIANGRWGLAQARERMLAMSPLYFTDRLPATLAMFGREDPVVVVRNAIVLDSALQHVPKRTGERQVVVAEMGGHADTDPVVASRLTRSFLARYLGTPVGDPLPGGDGR